MLFLEKPWEMLENTEISNLKQLKEGIIECGSTLKCVRDMIITYSQNKSSRKK